VLEEIGFIQDEIYRLNQSIKKYQKEVKELTEALRKEVQS
jgi:peptidoglycan hydrolase CwlO-like protein